MDTRDVYKHSSHYDDRYSSNMCDYAYILGQDLTISHRWRTGQDLVPTRLNWNIAHAERHNFLIAYSYGAQPVGTRL